jgi:quinol monooxygenase YgiN
MIRVWRGTVLTSDRDRYVDYVKSTGVADSRAARGNISARVATRDLDEGYSEVLLISEWESAAALEGLVGYDIAQPMLYPEDHNFLIRQDVLVRTYNLH